jgi:hypothetical protein
MTTKLLARLNDDDIHRLHHLMKLIARKGKTIEIPAIKIENREELWRHIERIEEELETKFIIPPDDYLKLARGFIDQNSLVMNLIIPMWDEVSQSDYSVVVDIYLNRTPHLIEVADFRVL